LEFAVLQPQPRIAASAAVGPEQVAAEFVGFDLGYQREHAAEVRVGERADLRDIAAAEVWLVGGKDGGWLLGGAG
jgi:hypothetical protein